MPDRLMPAADQALQQAQDCLAQGRWEQAERLCLPLLQVQADRAPAWFVAGVAALEQRHYAAALARLRQATALRPDDVAAWVQLARALSTVQRTAESLQAAEQATRLQPREALAHDTLGVVLSRGNQHEAAVRQFEAAVRLRPGNAGYQFNLASSLKFLGQFERAEAAYEACIAANPQYWRAHSSLAQLRRQTPERHHLPRLQGLLARGNLDGDARLHLHLALAKELEDLDQPRAAFVHTTLGKAAKRATLHYSPEEDGVLFDALQAAFAEEMPIPGPLGDPAAAPVFVVGMPRTGTTLVERILSSHPSLCSVGESQNLPRAIKQASGIRTPAMLDVETIRAAAGTDMRAAGQHYLEQTRPGPGLRFVDKLPMNFFYAGFIARALPHARIVCLRRHPLDACLSNFRQLFALQFPYYRYAYDLLDTGRYYIAFDRLIAHWRRVLPGRLLELSYEALVDQPEVQARRVLEFCDLPWDPACLQFERHPQAVSTASAVQVRQPIYRSSVNRWQVVAEELAPLRALLHDGGIRFDS